MFQNTQTYEYDNQGRVTKTKLFLEKNNLRTYSLNKYDKDGRKTETKILSPEGSEVFTYYFSYDKRDNLIQFENSFWEYDNKPNPFKVLKVPYWDESWASPNNTIRNFGKDNNGKMLNIQNIEYTYDNKTGYPLTMKTSGENRPEVLYEFIYR